MLTKLFMPSSCSMVTITTKKKSLKAKKSKAGDDTNPTNNGVKRLKLSDPIVNGLTTEIMIGDREACKMAKRWFQKCQ